MKQNKITFSYMAKPFPFPNRNKLKQFILTHAEEQKLGIKTLQYVFSTDKYLLELNQEFLKHNYLTDILTFPFSQDPVVADIYISINRVQENSLIHQVPFNDELLRVIFHGYLHLLGLNDESNDQKIAMRKKEEELIKAFKFHVKQ